jgi:1-acyl-sn-glycerol-3-phosphate acyltransferase
LRAAELFSPDEGEASLAEKVKITAIPLSRARQAAEALRDDDEKKANEKILAAEVKVEVDGKIRQAPLGDLLDDIARRAVAAVAAGGLLASRYNYLNNFAWFGVSVWLVAARAEVALYHNKGGAAALRKNLADDLLRAKKMQLEFFAAHREDPRQVRGYWYGQRYSYLTRDMADLAARIAETANILGDEKQKKITLPPLLTNRAGGRFMEYPDVGADSPNNAPRRFLPFVRWTINSVRLGMEKRRIAGTIADPEIRRERGWAASARWARRVLDNFQIRLRVDIHPLFAPMMREFGVAADGRGVLFLPTHQSLLDHYLLYRILESPPLLRALGQTAPRPCVIVARPGLAKAAGIRLGKGDITIFGMSSARFDELLQEVDGCIMPRAEDLASAADKKAAPQLADEMKKRPALIYPMGTTAAFANQIFPLQHSLFAQLAAQETVIVPIALRGAHSLWPKCPKGNLHIRSGAVRAVIAPPMLAATVLLPRRRALRIQAETAALFQAVHIAELLNPEFTPEKSA